MAGGGESATSDAFEWNGFTFNNTKSINTARFYGAVGSQGTVNSHLFMGGRTPTYLANTEEYSCSTALEFGAWSADANMNTARTSHAGAGIAEAALTFGGNTTGTQTLGYDGTSWSTRPSLSTGRTYFAGFGTNTAALAAANNPAATTVEEYTGAETTAVNVKTLTQS